MLIYSNFVRRINLKKIKKIAFFTPSMGVGGAERYIIQKIKWLKKNNYDAVVISAGGSWSSYLTEIGVKHYVFEMINEDPFLLSSSIFFESAAYIGEILLSEEVSIIESNQYTPALWAEITSKLFKIPNLLNVLSAAVFYDKHKSYLEFLKYMNTRKLYYNSECSNQIIEKRRKIELANCVQIPIPVDKLTNNYTDTNEKDNYVLSICRMSPEKMYIISLIKEFQKLIISSNYTGLKLIIVGDGPRLSKVMELVNKVNVRLERYSSKIIMKGKVVGEELEYLYANCLFYIGMGTTVIQAAQHKKASILSSPIKRQMKLSPGYFGVDKYNSIGFKYEDMKMNSFYSRMKYLLENPLKRIELENRSYDKYIELYETQKIMSWWIKEYKRVILQYESTRYSTFEVDKIFYFAKRVKKLVKEILKWSS